MSISPILTIISLEGAVQLATTPPDHMRCTGLTERMARVIPSPSKLRHPRPRSGIQMSEQMQFWRYVSVILSGAIS